MTIMIACDTELLYKGISIAQNDLQYNMPFIF